MDNIKERREMQVARRLPDLFTVNHYDSVLYVGANQKRQHFLDKFQSAKYNRIVILEAFKDNFEFLEKKFAEEQNHHEDKVQPDICVIHEDIRNFDALGQTFDVIFFWHGIEHLRKAEIEPTLKKLENNCKLVVLGMPYGMYEQGPEYGNPFEEHMSAIYPPFLEKLGYETDVIGAPDTNGSNMLAWKFPICNKGT